MNKQVANARLMQKMNRLKVLNYLRTHPDSSRPQIAKETGLSMPSITNIITYLLDIGIICESGVEKVDRVGRRGVLLSLCASKYDLICVHLDASSINIFRTDLLGKIKEKRQISTENLPSEKFTQLLCDDIAFSINSHNKNKILGIGIAISGLVLSDSRFIMSSHLKLKSFDIKQILEEKTNIPVFIDNVSIQKAILYFSKEQQKTGQNMIFVDLKNGIGAVQYVNSAVLRSTVGEIGHTTIKKDGPLCFCGNRGCLETMCSPERLMYLYNTSSNKEVTSLKEVETLYNSGDKSAVYAVDECGEYLGICLANLVNLFSPSVMVINTGDFTDCPSVITVAENKMKERAYATLTQTLSITKTTETEDTVVLGTAFDLCDKLFDISFPKNIIE